MPTIRKVTAARAASADDMEFVLSDESKDRYGDVIQAEGWELANFKRNPIALFNHDSAFPIGRWQNIHVEGKRLVGKLKLAAQGTSARIDEIIRLVEQDILRAVSVGFQPLEREALKDNSGVLFKRQELLETSLVSVPANPHAVQLARSLGISEQTIGFVFGEQAKERAPVTRSANGGKAETHPNGKFGKMKTLSERITERQSELVALKDQLAAHVAALADEPDDTAIAVTSELNGKIDRAQASLETLQGAEQRIVAATPPAPAGISRGGPLWDERRPYASDTARKTAPADYVMRTLVGMLVSKGSEGQLTVEQAIAQRYGSDGKIEDKQTVVCRALTRPEGVHFLDTVQRAATVPADTATSGWASQLVETSVAGFMELLLPASVYPGLSARGLRVSFGRSGIISIPTRLATPTIAGSFVAQGAAIPVRQGAFSSQTLSPKKMAVISTFTREIANHSTPAIEGLIKNAMQEDTSVALDTILLDNVAATAVRPAGLRAGVAATTATTGGGFNALVGDIKALAGALITASNGNIRLPVWIMNPVQALSISLTQNAGGEFPFATEVNQNRLQGYPLIQSSTVPAGMVILIDAADFVSVEGDAPQFAVSDQATLHMEDTAPTHISTPGSPNVVAAPVRSMFQTDSMALRMIMDLNWILRRTGVVAWTQAVTW